MGHTVWSQRITAKIILDELKQYGKSLRVNERPIYDSMLKIPLQKIGSISYANSYHTWAFLLLSIILEQEKKLRSYEGLLNRYLSEEEQPCVVDEDGKKLHH